MIGTKTIKEKDNQRPQSRFKPWIRIVAFIVIICFVSNDIAYAIGYNPYVLWGSRRVTQGENGFFVHAAIDNVKKALDSLAYTPLNKIELAEDLTIEAKPWIEESRQQSPAEPAFSSSNPYLNRISYYFKKTAEKFFKAALIFARKISSWAKPENLTTSGVSALDAIISFFIRGLAFVEDGLPKEELTGKTTGSLEQPQALRLTGREIKKMEEWLRNPETKIDSNCGIYSLVHFLESRGVKTTPEEVGVRLILVDFLSGNLRKFKGRYAASLFALNKVAQSFGLKASLVKTSLSNLQILSSNNFPFIAYLRPSHFVAVTSADKEKVYFKEGIQDSWLPKEIFVKKFTGNCLVNQIENLQITRISKQEALEIKGMGRINDFISTIRSSATRSLTKVNNFKTSITSTLSSPSRIYDVGKSAVGSYIKYKHPAAATAFNAAKPLSAVISPRSSSNLINNGVNQERHSNLPDVPKSELNYFEMAGGGASTITTAETNTKPHWVGAKVQGEISRTSKTINSAVTTHNSWTSSNREKHPYAAANLNHYRNELGPIAGPTIFWLGLASNPIMEKLTGYEPGSIGLKNDYQNYWNAHPNYRLAVDISLNIPSKLLLGKDVTNPYSSTLSGLDRVKAIKLHEALGYPVVIAAGAYAIAAATSAAGQAFLINSLRWGGTKALNTAKWGGTKAWNFAKWSINPSRVTTHSNQFMNIADTVVTSAIKWFGLGHFYTRGSEIMHDAATGKIGLTDIPNTTGEIISLGGMALSSEWNHIAGNDKALPQTLLTLHPAFTPAYDLLYVFKPEWGAAIDQEYDKKSAPVSKWWLGIDGPTGTAAQFIFAEDITRPSKLEVLGIVTLPFLFMTLATKVTKIPQAIKGIQLSNLSLNSLRLTKAAPYADDEYL